MGWSYEVALTGAAEAGPLADWFASGPKDALSTLPNLAFLDVYTPATGTAQDPYNHDGAGPVMLLMLGFESRESLAAALSSDAIEAALTPLPEGIVASGAAFERLTYPIGSGSEPAPLSAPFSYVVRYQLPAEDEAAFIENYIATHPTTQAHLPGIRAILCYLPLRDLPNPPGLSDPTYLIGNEVAFDDMDAFNHAMASPVREELREHFRTFPPFSGVNTHHPMQRTRIAGEV
ncbi:hypothetical protein [Amorphus sp. 3PC139-8]|uniref:hypothetical protein n=1 Tax=Amorphus sp. 3PC139-8 TaxID=2735676 RepID=UPI00345DF548